MRFRKFVVGCQVEETTEIRRQRMEAKIPPASIAGAILSSPFSNVKGERRSVHIIGGYGRTLEDYQALVTELQNKFPQAETKDILCSVVTESTWCAGCAIVVWSGYCDAPRHTNDEDWTWVQERYNYNYR